MEAELLRTKLQERSQTALLNPSEVTEESLQTTTEETLEILAGRELPMWRTLDIAMFRLHLLLKSQPSELEMKAYEAAIKVLERTPLPAPTATSQTRCVVRGRVSEW